MLVHSLFSPLPHSFSLQTEGTCLSTGKHNFLFKGSSGRDLSMFVLEERGWSLKGEERRTWTGKGLEGGKGMRRGTVMGWEAWYPEHREMHYL